jgi:hypothetical protein
MNVTPSISCNRQSCPCAWLRTIRGRRAKGAFSTSTPDGGECPVSSSGRFIWGEWIAGTHWTECLIGDSGSERYGVETGCSSYRESIPNSPVFRPQYILHTVELAINLNLFSMHVINVIKIWETLVLLLFLMGVYLGQNKVQWRALSIRWRTFRFREALRFLTAECLLKKLTLWPESARELYRPSDRRLSAKLMSMFSDRGCHVVSVTNPYGRNLGFIDRSRYFFFQVVPQLYSRGWVDRTSGSVARNSDH